MRIFKRLVKSVLLFYGIEGAKKPSFHGLYEKKVPECLSNKEY